VTEQQTTWQAVVVVDMQVDFFNDPELERCRADLVRTCNQIIDAARDQGLLVVEVRTEHTEDGSTWALNMVDDGAGMTIAGTPGAEPVQGLHHADATDGVVLVRKTRDNAFHDTDLGRVLAGAGVEALLLCGVSTESCIVATATDAYARDYRVTIVRDATASVRWDLHDQALDSLREQYRQPAISAGDAIGAMAQGR
jgi:nicotinamidase-related amidase